MAVRINPCFGCPLRKGCTLRAEWRDKVSGLGLRSAWFVCPRLSAEIRPGRRVVISQPVADWGKGYYGEDEYTVERIQVPATITAVQRADHRFACVIDPGHVTEDQLFGDGARDGHGPSVNDVRFRKKQAHRRIIRFLDEPDGTLCANNNVVRDGTCDTKSGERCEHFDWLQTA